MSWKTCTVTGLLLWLLSVHLTLAAGLLLWPSFARQKLQMTIMTMLSGCMVLRCQCASWRAKLRSE